MKNSTIKALFLSFIMLLSLTTPVFATAETEMKDTGWAEITIDVTNPPEGFDNYNFYINFVNEETGEWTLLDVLAINEYKGTAMLPYGKYYIAEAGVKNDYMSKFALTTGEPFELTKENPSVEFTLTFANSGFGSEMGNSETSQNPGENTGETVENPTSSDVQADATGYGYLGIKLDESIELINEITVVLFNIDTLEEIQMILNADNQYATSDKVPVGQYIINEDKSVVNGMENMIVTTDNKDIKVVASRTPTMVTLQLKDKNEIVTTPEDPTIGETPGDIPGENQAPPVTTPFGNMEFLTGSTRITILIISGGLFLIFSVVGLMKFKKYL